MKTSYCRPVYNKIMEPKCPVCHTVVRPSDYYCFNCGKNLHEKPLSTSLTTELMYYAGSLLLPPMGIWWGFKYLRQDDPVSKRIGYMCMVITVVATILAVRWTMQIMTGVNAQVNQQLQGIQGF